MQNLKVVIADDHPIVLVGVREMVMRDPRFSVVAEAVSPSQLVEHLQTHRPDVLITDYNMPGDAVYGDGLKLIEFVLRSFPGTQVLVLTMVSNTLILSRLKELGVAGVIQKNHLHEEIQNALGALSSQSNYRGPQLPNHSVRSNTLEVDERFAKLSPKELEVVRLFVEGLSVSDIARQLGRSIKTVSTQKIAAMRKLDVDSDQALLTYCIRVEQFQ